MSRLILPMPLTCFNSARFASISCFARPCGNSMTTTYDIHDVGSFTGANLQTSQRNDVTPTLSVAAGTGGQKTGEMSVKPTSDMVDPGYSNGGAKLDQPSSWNPIISTTQGALVRPNINGDDLATFMTDLVGEDTGVHASIFQNSIDEMDIDHLCSFFNFVKTIPLSYEANAGDLLTTIDLSPFQVMGPNRPFIASPQFSLTIQEFVASMFRYYTGGLRFKFEVVGPRELSGSLVFVLRYGDWDAPASYLDEATGQSVIMDFRFTEREVVLRVDPVTPLIWQQPYYTMAQNATGLIPKPLLQHCSYGTLHIFYGSKLATSSAVYTAPPELNFFMANDSDTQYSRLQPCSNLSLIPIPPPPAVRTAPEDSDDESVVMIPPDIESFHGTKFGTRRLALAPKSATIHTDASRMETTISKIPLATPPAAAPTSLPELAAKWTILDTITIDGSSTGLLWSATHPADVLKAQALYAQQASVYYRGDVEIQLTPLTAGWAAGKVILTFNPFATPASLYSLTRQSQLPHVTLDLSAQEAVSLTVPFQHYLEFFNSNDPTIVGSFQLSVMNVPQFPTTGISELDIRIEARWPRFETYIPAATGLVPSFSTFARRGRHGHTLLPVKEMSGDGAKETVEDRPLTSSEAASEPGISVNAASPVPMREPNIMKNFRNLWKRPIPLGTVPVTFPVTEREVGFVLTCNPFSPGETDFKNSNFHNLISSLYAGYRGDFIITLVCRDSDITNISVTVGTMCATNYTGGSLVATPVTGLLAFSGTPSRSTPPQANRSARMLTASGLAPPGLQAPVAYNPVTTMRFDGTVRFTVPFQSSNRWAAIPATVGDVNTAYPAARNDIIPYVVLQAQVPSVDTETHYCEFDVWVQPADGARCAVFCGVPPLALDYVLTGSAPFRNQYWDTNFPFSP